MLCLRIFLAVAIVLVNFWLTPHGVSRWGPSGCTAAEPVGSKGRSNGQWVCTPQGCFWTEAASTPVAVATQPVEADPAKAKYEWKKGTESQTWLMKNGKIVGQWYHPDQTFYPFDGKKDGKAQKPPIDPPTSGAQSLEKLQAWQLSGVDHSKIDAGREVVTFGGQPLDPDKMGDAFAGNLADDSNKGYLIFLSKDPAKRQAGLTDWSALPKDFTDRYHFWAPPPDHFSMQDRFAGHSRFPFDHDPMIILEAPGGKVLFRHPKSAEQVYESKNMQALLKADPNYKKELDPGIPASNSGTSIPMPVVLGAVGVGLFALSRRKK